MIEIGKINRLKIVRSSDFGLMLDDGAGGEILLPNREVPGKWTEGEKLDVFVYHDSEARLTALRTRPKVLVGEFAFLQVKEVSKVGAFLDWGLPKDLFVPFREQRIPMKPGESYLVYVYLDRISGRIVASAKLDRFLKDSRRFFKPGEQVDLIIWQPTDLGFKAIIEHERWGMIFHSEVFQPLRRGQHLSGFIKGVRPDGNIDLVLQQPGYGKVPKIAEQILDALRKSGGFMPLTAKTPPEEIHALFGVSKKTYKQGVGALYRKRLISVDDDGIRLV
ncbi:MAG: GntR family transcriptional regulator [Pontiellaceae bacterium]|nr:GntR family transcriptional regulator [Pontiellaceae bacterium]MBN2784597.1 GntR family transcriptional regulator [Pontiellaceae bacterium]